MESGRLSVASSGFCEASRLTGKLQKVQFQNAGNNGYLILLKDIVWNRFAGIDRGSEVVGGSEWNINEPDAAASFVAFEVWVIWPGFS